MCVTLTSCSEESQGWWGDLLGGLLGGPSTTNVYSASFSMCQGPSTGNPNEYAFGGASVCSGDIVVVLKNNNTVADIKIPAVTLTDGTSTPAADIYNLAVTTEEDGSLSIDLGENSSIDATMNVGGSELPGSYVYLGDVCVKGNKLSARVVQVFYGEELDYCIDYSDLTGTLKPSQVP